MSSLFNDIYLEKDIYRILPNKRAGANTKKSRGALVYLNQNDVGRLRGFPNLQFRF